MLLEEGRSLYVYDSLYNLHRFYSHSGPRCQRWRTIRVVANFLFDLCGGERVVAVEVKFVSVA